MKVQRVEKDWPYAYHNLQESLSGLIPHLQRNGLDTTQPLSPNINPKLTPQQLENCIAVLTPSIKLMKESNDLGQKVTGMLLERFVADTQRFHDDLQHEIELMGSGFAHNVGDYAE